MSRLVVAFTVMLVATTAMAQNALSRQSQAPAATRTNGPRPFLFDGRMKCDGVRRGKAGGQWPPWGCCHHRAAEGEPARAQGIAPGLLS